MMTVAPVASAADAASYYSSKDNYYFLDDLESQWLGEGAKELGLEGPVDLQTFTDVLHGKLPNGVELGKEVQGSHVHRPGHDLTFSAPKSISMLILAGGDKRLLDAHHEAVKDALGVIENLISARDTKDGITRIVPTEKMVAALFTHDTSRNLDPQIHTHAVIVNATELDGKWKALSTDYIHGTGFIETIYKHQVKFGQIYRSSLKTKTEALGYETELTGGPHDLWEVKGFTETVLEEFSSRHREIHLSVGEEASLKSRDVAALDTRQRKQSLDRYGEDDVNTKTVPENSTPAVRDERSPLQVKADALKEAGGINKADSVSPETAGKVISHSGGPDVSGSGLPDKVAGNEEQHITGPLNEDLARRNDYPEEASGPERFSADSTELPLTEPALADDRTGNAKNHDLKPVQDEEPIAKPETERGRSRLQERWKIQMEKLGFDIQEVISEAKSREVQQTEPEADISKNAIWSVQEAISVLSDSQTRFTYGDLLVTAFSAGEYEEKIPDLKRALDEVISSGELIPLDAEKGVFTSRIHLLDELSLQSVAADAVKENVVASFRTPKSETPERFVQALQSPVAILNSPSSALRQRETAEQLVTLSRAHGRDVMVMASSAERALSLGKSDLLKDNLMHRSRILDSSFTLTPQSTLVVEGAERLGLKEMLVLTGEALEKNAQLLFLDGAGRTSATSALSVLEQSGVPRLSLSEPSSGLETRVISIADKRDRYQALATRYAELSGPETALTATVVGEREQQQLNDQIRSALKDAGKLGQEEVIVEARIPVYTSAKTRKLANTYRPGQVLEDRSDKNETRHYVIDRVHEKSRQLSLVDSDGVETVQDIRKLNGDWRLFERESLQVAGGERLFAVAGDKHAGIKARDRLTVESVSDGQITLLRDGQKKPVRVETGRPLYLTHAYVSAPGSQDNDRGMVLASLNGRDLTANMMNSLARSGHEAEVFTGEPLVRAEDRIARMRATRSPLSLVRQASGRDDAAEALTALKSGLQTDVQKAFSRAVEQMRDVAFTEVELLKEAMKFGPGVPDLQKQFEQQVADRDLIRVQVGGEFRYVARATWEMEKTIVREIADGKNAVPALMENVSGSVTAGLTAGQTDATRLILESKDRFTAIQGYAGTGKTTQFRAVKAGLDTLPDGSRPQIVGLAPTHRAVKEMRSVGIEAQTLKSFIVDWQQRTAAGESVRFENTLFLIDESSMLGNQDTAVAYKAISTGNGRAVSVGDIAQFTSPESGAPFRLVQERSPIDVAVMKEIVRQRDENIKSAVYSVIENKAAAAIEKIMQVQPSAVPRAAGVVQPERSVTETKAPVEAIVADYMGRTAGAREKTLIIAQLNEDRRAINQGIHDRLFEAKELGNKAVNVPVLERVTGGRHDFNRTSSWKSGQVVMVNDSYLSVTAVDSGINRIVLRDENGRTKFYSPAELNATEIEVFERKSLELRVGDSLRMTKTQKQAGHTAHEQYRVQALRDNGEVVLRSAAGEKVIEPGKVTADQHIDYAWAVTGYGAQGASAEYVIALEGTEGARQRMSGMRAFYISISRAVDHVQIYTDGMADWMATLRNRDNGPETAHDAIDPQPERSQARLIWGMGKPASKTAIGRTFLREQGLKNSPLTVRIIPPTKKYPEPHLALPVFDGNGKTAGVSLYPISADAGQMTTGAGRELATREAQAAVLQKSRNGETMIVTSLGQGLDAARTNPHTGVILQTGRKTPTDRMLKVAGGQPERAYRSDAALVSLVQHELTDMLRNLPPDGPVRDESALLQAALVALEKSQGASFSLPETDRSERAGEPDMKALARKLATEAAREDMKLPEKTEPDGMAEMQKLAKQLMAEAQAVVKLPETDSEKETLNSRLLTRVVESVKQQIPALPGEKEPDYARLIGQAAGELSSQGGLNAASASAVLNALANGGMPGDIRLPAETGGAGAIPASVIRKATEELDRSVQAPVRAQAELSERAIASAARELERQSQPTLPAEGRGREREEPVPEITRNIQKER
ncbi:conjugal transfer protein TraI (plasmid) [Pantoea ananatis]|uniref:MobF family relaxase n=2 Tax=Pantoea ananas TaxID=553 RepID=UPI000B5F3732|nr:MobF family relaxase [Pantoea ananatis]ASN18264.1 conjugal transfer protein TraI [Pantoea ananatis]